jgi:ABC-2 type transport system permease protein
MPEGVVYDLGYRPHEGERLGRAGAVRALYRDGVRRVLGMRRRARRKVLPAVLIGIAVLPALFFVALDVFLADFGDLPPFFDHPGYFDWMGNFILIFCALAAGELLIPDRQYGTIAVYASRPLRAVDYVGGRAAAMVAVVFGFVWLPHLVLLVGRAWTSSEGFGAYLGGNLDVLWQTAVATLVYLAAYGAPAFAAAVYSSRQSLAIFLYLVAFYAVFATAHAVVAAGYRIVGIASLPDHAGSVKDWIMGSDTQEWLAEAAGIAPALSLLIIAAITGASAWLVMRRYRSEL